MPIYGVPVQTRELFGVLHLKGSVIDDCVIYSGASINNVYLHKLDKYRLDRYHLIESAPLADAFQNLVQREILPSPAVPPLPLPSPPRSARPPPPRRPPASTCNRHLARAAFAARFALFVRI
ncbi:CDP-diacylglycerol--serine O-phosphatidyltransferase [Pseudomonas savastanoi pv. phaseolicola]|nr:CDP-diacylglycerol--serine O-phosphatidyltransferase [Pseudomonas savastanoi pv. phaseolicola]KPB73594.1 CDP-diacylglycerol--serine O-phosphatidyltransferase [Pseudomonas amygdali pv. mellea]